MIFEPAVSLESRANKQSAIISNEFFAVLGANEEKSNAVRNITGNN